jgi:hypothetical protein
VISSKASATVLLILETCFRFLELQLPLEELSQQLHLSSIGELLLALILARHLPDKMLLTLMEPAA